MQTRGSQYIYWTVTHVDMRDLLIAATDHGLCYLQFMNSTPLKYVEDEAWSELLKWARTYAPEYKWIHEKEPLVPYIAEVEAYLRGIRTLFTIPLDLRGTPFQMAVWKALQNIPHGHTKTYSQIAHELDKSKAVRAVGTAIGANPVLIVIPCHRVLGKDGSLTGYRGGLQNKESLLLLEKSCANQCASAPAVVSSI